MQIKSYVREFFPYLFLVFVYLRNLCVSWEVIQISNILDAIFKWIISVLLRSDRLRLVHCSFSSNIAKQIHLPIQFVVAKQIHLPIQLVIANLGCFFQSGPVQYVLFLHSFVLLSFKILECCYRMIVSVSKLLLFTVHSNLNRTMFGKGK